MGKKTRKYGPTQRKKKSNTKGSCESPDLLDKDFKFAILNILRELKTLLIEVKNKKSVA